VWLQDDERKGSPSISRTESTEAIQSVCLKTELPANLGCLHPVASVNTSHVA
jgi:hypothetical protein